MAFLTPVRVIKLIMSLRQAILQYYSTVQYSTVQYSTVQYSTIQNRLQKEIIYDFQNISSKQRRDLRHGFFVKNKTTKFQIDRKDLSGVIIVHLALADILRLVTVQLVRKKVPLKPADWSLLCRVFRVDWQPQLCTQSSKK